jgi:hypothetical protein
MIFFEARNVGVTAVDCMSLDGNKKDIYNAQPRGKDYRFLFCTYRMLQKYVTSRVANIKGYRTVAYTRHKGPRCGRLSIRFYVLREHAANNCRYTIAGVLFLSVAPCGR